MAKKPGRPEPRTGRRPPPKVRRPAGGSRILRWAVTALLWAGLAAGIIIAYYAFTLPRVTDTGGRTDRTPTIALVTTDGTTIATRGRLQGPPVTLSEVPPYLPAAVIATEDRRFYDHFGLDLWGILRAAFANVRAGDIVQGGSTITQQVAKNVFLSPERTVARKIQEVLLALWLEERYSKDEILALYLNRVYFGAGTYGVEAAAQRYFGKRARELTLSEAALLAGLLKAPSRYAPTNDPEAAQGRAVLVLRNMVDAGYLRPADAQAAQARPARLAGGPGLLSANYFADWVLSELSDKRGSVTGVLTVVTTLDLRMQKAAEDAVKRAVDRNGAKFRIGQAALVALDPSTGAVRAMVGGRSYRDSSFNRATQAKRQPGSAFKPIVYLTAMEQGLTPDTVMRDSPVIFDKWKPENYEGRYQGEVTLRSALAESINTVAVKVSERAGRFRVIDMAHKLGIASDLTPTPSVALGSSELTLLELTAAYAPFANGGGAVAPHGILEVRDGDGRLLYRREEAAPTPVANPWSIAAMNDMLTSVMRFGTGTAARLPDRPAGGKTGTSQSFRDALFLGYVPQLVAGVWMGNDDGKPMANVKGGGIPARTWKAFMTEALAGQPALPLPMSGRRPSIAYMPYQPRSTVADRDGQNMLEDLLGRIRAQFR